MSRWHNHYLDNHAHWCTATVHDWRSLLDDDAIQVLYEQWEITRRSMNVKVLAYVVMPNHVHIVLWTEQGDAVKTFLHRTLGEISKRLQPGGGFWKERPRVFPMHSPAVIKAKIDYTHRNPLHKGLATNPEDWPHSSFRQLEMGRSDVAFLCDDWNGI